MMCNECQQYKEAFEAQLRIVREINDALGVSPHAQIQNLGGQVYLLVKELNDLKEKIAARNH